ncbi:MAG: hypothetical protein K0S18_1948 [Anaerocolumna sp.]|jgi:hypothetical protein|nr:hypothetical protein [Anaerocolumna sp.]
MGKMFRSTQEMINYLKQTTLKQMVEKIGEDIKYLIKAYMEESFYGQYNPKYYVRTFQLLESVTTSEVHETANGYEIEIFLDIDSIHYKDGYEEEIVWLASQGFHGSSNIYEQGEFWNEAVVELQNGYIIKKFGEYLKAKGWNVTTKANLALPK